jgi:hypothetical protein
MKGGKQMKRFMIIGAISVGVAVCVLFAYQVVFSAGVGPGSGSKYLIIKVDTRSGNVVSKQNEDEVAAEIIGQDEFDSIKKKSKIATIYHSEQSPGCAWIKIGGRYYRVCN